MSTGVFITALFLIAKNWKQPNFPSAGEWINCGTNVQCILFSTKRDRPLIQVAPQVNLKSSVQSERSQTQKATFYTMLLISPSDKGQI